MLKRIHLENFRCFKDSRISFKDLTVFVGKNNSGKSCLIEALRMVSMASRMCTRTTYTNSPNVLGINEVLKGFRLPVENIKIDLISALYFYKQDKPAVITAYFEDKIIITVYIREGIAFASVEFDSQIVNSRFKAKELNIQDISILPQIGPIKEKEKGLSNITVTQNMDTYLSSRHFRNEMLLFKDSLFQDFKDLAESTWPSLRISEIEYNTKDNDITLFIQDAGFPAEIGLMGNGIQMWLQIIWFICRSKTSETVILDEPDVYMHPELQLKILKIAQKNFKQVIIATHSVEIISNVSLNNIVSINKKTRKMNYASDIEDCKFNCPPYNASYT